MGKVLRLNSLALRKRASGTESRLPLAKPTAHETRPQAESPRRTSPASGGARAAHDLPQGEEVTLQLPCVKRASDVCSFERRVDRFSVDKPKPHPRPSIRSHLQVPVTLRSRRRAWPLRPAGHAANRSGEARLRPRAQGASARGKGRGPKCPAGKKQTPHTCLT